MIPVKVCLNAFIMRGPNLVKLKSPFLEILAEELNVLEVRYEDAPTFSVAFDCNQNEEAIRRTEERIRQSEEAQRRKKLGLKIGEIE